MWTSKNFAAIRLFPSLGSRRQKPGFTLIEMLVGISLFGIFFGLGLTQYNRFNRRQTLLEAARELKSHLRFAQQKAVAGEMDCDSTECGGLDGTCGTADPGEKSLAGWHFRLNGTNAYEILGECCDSNFPPNCEEFSEKSISLSRDQMTIGGSDILFYPLDRGTNGPATLTLTYAGQTESVFVSASGEIK